MTDQELIRALRCCVSSPKLDKCREECVFFRGHDMANCIPQMGQAVADRLAAYEDTGLEPEDLTRVFNEEAILKLAGQVLGTTPDCLRELAQADREGRCVVLPDAKYTDTDGETALRRAMYICGVQNNAVTRYTADAIAEKLTREEAEKALGGDGDDCTDAH